MQRLLRFGVVGDVHADDELLSTSLEFFQEQLISDVLCVGDIVDGNGNVDRCVELLKTQRVFTVRGNHERWFLANQMRQLPDATLRESVSRGTVEFLDALPLAIEFSTAHGKLLLCHGLGDDDMAGVGPDEYGYALDNNSALQNMRRSDYRWIINGHTHRRCVRTFGDSLTVINAGTLHRPHGSSLVLVDFTKSQLEFFDVEGSNVVRHAETISLAP